MRSFSSFSINCKLFLPQRSLTPVYLIYPMTLLYDVVAWQQPVSADKILLMPSAAIPLLTACGGTGVTCKYHVGVRWLSVILVVKQCNDAAAFWAVSEYNYGIVLSELFLFNLLVINKNMHFFFISKSEIHLSTSEY